jgi:hypothetical protein
MDLKLQKEHSDWLDAKAPNSPTPPILNGLGKAFRGPFMATRLTVETEIFASWWLHMRWKQIFVDQGKACSRSSLHELKVDEEKIYIVM